jgi:hypothetical protein
VAQVGWVSLRVVCDGAGTCQISAVGCCGGHHVAAAVIVLTVLAAGGLPGRSSAVSGLPPGFRRRAEPLGALPYCWPAGDLAPELPVNGYTMAGAGDAWRAMRTMPASSLRLGPGAGDGRQPFA